MLVIQAAKNCAISGFGCDTTGVLAPSAAEDATGALLVDSALPGAEGRGGSKVAALAAFGNVGAGLGNPGFTFATRSFAPGSDPFSALSTPSPLGSEYTKNTKTLPTVGSSLTSKSS